MQFRTITRIVGLLIILFSGLMFLPGIVALIYRDGAGRAFSQTFMVTLLLGTLLWLPNRKQRHELKAREGFLIVVLFWTVLGSVGALPFLFSDQLGMSVTNAFFESFSGLTTTGATTLVGLDHMPKAILFYRSMLHWLGGMGIIVLAVAILPLLGVGGMQLYRAEIPGPLKDSKMRPRIAETAKTLWLIYVLLTIACGVSLWSAGMAPFDAMNYSFSIVSIGGFSTHDVGLAFYDSYLINNISAVFLFLAGCNFALHFAAASGKGVKAYAQDPEFRTYLFIQLTLILICTGMLWKFDFYDSFLDALNQSFFHVISLATTSGITTTDVSGWPLFLPMILLLSTFIGGCAGSVGGGLKVIRVLMLYLQGSRELRRLVHPSAVYTIKLGNRALPERVIEAVWGFFFVYALVFLLSLLALMATGIEAYPAFTGAASALNNLGTGMGNFANNYTQVNDSAKWILVVTMLFGRLEIFTLLILFTPSFWRD